MRKVLTLVLCGCLCGALSAAETMTDMRKQMQDATAGIASSMFTERIKGLRLLTSMLDPQLLSEFRIIEKVRDIAKNSAENPNVRIEALNTLVIFKTNGIDIPKLLETLDEIIKKDTNVRVLNAALAQIPNVAPMQPKGAPANVERDKAVTTLRDMYAKKKNLADSTYRALVRALGNFGDKEGALKILYEVANGEKIREVREDALRSIRDAVTALGIVDKKSTDSFETMLAAAKGEDNRYVRVLIFDCLESMLAHIPVNAKTPYKPRNSTRDTALGMLNNGNDVEVIAAVKFLMRIPQDPKLVDELLKAALPNPNRQPRLTFKALEIANAALVNVLYNIARDKKNAADAQKIIDRMLTMLNPSETGTPEEIKETMIMGLGIIPPIFDREKAVLCLIALLEIEGKKEAPIPGRIRQLEDALISLTNSIAFQNVEFIPVENEDGTVRMQKKVTPDIEGWTGWFEANKSKLKAGGI